jgi:hypothetical protein
MAPGRNLRLFPPRIFEGRRPAKGAGLRCLSALRLEEEKSLAAPINVG